MDSSYDLSGLEVRFQWYRAASTDLPWLILEFPRHRLDFCFHCGLSAGVYTIMNQSSNHIGQDQDFGTGTKTFGIYLLGFVLCVILTLIPFLAVMHEVGSKMLLMEIIFVSAIIQFFVQVICFLRLNTATQQGQTNVMSFIFTGVVLVVLIGGSVWIMTSLNYFMMH